MSFTPESVYAMLQTRGQPVTVRRLGTSPPTDVTVLAKIDEAGDQPLAGNMSQFMRNAVFSDLEIAQTGWPGPPKRNDQIIAQGQTSTIQTVDTTVIGDLTVMHKVTILGA